LTDAEAAGRLARDRHLRRITAERGDVLLHPFERGDLVEEAEAARARLVADVEEARRAEPVIQCHRDHAVARERRSVVEPDRAGAPLEAAAVNPHEHRQRGKPGCRCPDVQVEAVVALRHPPRQARGIDRALAGLRADVAEPARIAYALPPRDANRRGESPPADRRFGAGDAAEHGDAVLDDAAHGALSGRDDWRRALRANCRETGCGYLVHDVSLPGS